MIRYRWLLLALVGPVMLASTYLAWQNDLDDSMTSYIDSQDYFRVDMDAVEKGLTGAATLVYDLNSGRENGVSDPLFMAKVDAFATWLRQQPGVRQVTSYTDTMKDLNADMHGGDPAWYRLPESADLAAQYLLLYELSLPFGLDLNTVLDMVKSGTRLVVVIDDSRSMAMTHMVERFDKKLAEIAPELATTPTGSSVSSNQVLLDGFYSMLISAVSAIVIIALILLFTFRQIMPGVLCVLMIISPLLVAFSIWYLIEGNIGLPASTALCMVIGIVVDNSVHFLTKYLRTRRLSGKSPEESVLETFVAIGSPLVSNTVVLAGGFLLFQLSIFQFNRVMGEMTVLGVVLSLVGTFTLLPSLLLLMEQFKAYRLAGKARREKH